MSGHYASPHEFVCGDCGQTREIDLTPGEAPPERCVRCRVGDDAVAVHKALVDLVNAMPRCDHCTAPATRSAPAGPGYLGYRYCDGHPLSFKVPDTGYAVALRAAISCLKRPA